MNHSYTPTLWTLLSRRHATIVVLAALAGCANGVSDGLGGVDESTPSTTLLPPSSSGEPSGPSTPASPAAPAAPAPTGSGTTPEPPVVPVPPGSVTVLKCTFRQVTFGGGGQTWVEPIVDGYAELWKENADITGVVGNPSFFASVTLATNRLFLRAKPPAGFPYEAHLTSPVVPNGLAQVTTTQPGVPDYNVTLSCSVE